MPTNEVTLDDLRRILREAAGENESAGLDGDILDVLFDDLGYDSLALLETSGRIEREFRTRLDDATVSHATTPRALITAVNRQLVAG